MFFLIESVREKLKKVQLQEVLNKAFKKRSRGLPGGSLVKNPPANAGDTGSIPGSGRSPEEEMATGSSILAGRIP